MITKSQVLLDRSSNVPGLYLQMTDHAGYEHFSLMLAAGLQHDLGDPDQITVTVEPGDRLNG